MPQPTQPLQARSPSVEADDRFFLKLDDLVQSPIEFELSDFGAGELDPLPPLRASRPPETH